MPVKLTTSHPVVEEGGDTVWNVGTSVDEKGGYSYSVIKFHKDRPGVTGTMMIEDAQVRVFSQRLHFLPAVRRSTCGSFLFCIFYESGQKWPKQLY